MLRPPCEAVGPASDRRPDRLGGVCVLAAQDDRRIGRTQVVTAGTARTAPMSRPPTRAPSPSRDCAPHGAPRGRTAESCTSTASPPRRAPPTTPPPAQSSARASTDPVAPPGPRPATREAGRGPDRPTGRLATRPPTNVAAQGACCPPTSGGTLVRIPRSAPPDRPAPPAAPRPPLPATPGPAARRSTIGRPQPVAFIDRLPRPEPLGQIPPLHPRSHPVQDPVDHLPMIPPPATTPRADRGNGSSRSHSASVKSPRPTDRPTTRQEDSHTIRRAGPSTPAAVRYLAWSEASSAV
ncbi:hypothetical protein OV320_2527 [Actinobacteria bacterium OV320]|nr:hypothetical protein OV320_2527 [Actinobacteria bacterium OV320]